MSFLRLLIVSLVATLLGLGGLNLMYTGHYGITLFVVIPMFVGAASEWIFAPSTMMGAAAIAFASMAIPFLVLIGLRIEGLLCIGMAAPIAIPLAAFGAFVAHMARARVAPAAILLLLPPSVAYDTSAQPVVYAVRTAIVINAPPAAVWPHVISFPELPEPTEWYFRAGLAYPQRARIAGRTRYCEFSTGAFVEPIEVWDVPRLLRFRVTENPEPMREWNPFAEIHPKHLQGYMISKQGQFELTALPGNRTELAGTTWYQHGLYPAEYWRWWSDAIIHRIHLRVLNHIRGLSEVATDSHG